MKNVDYDIIVVGGGLAAAALSAPMARHGARVLVLEREEVFKDRVRGEGMTPWGVAEAQALGIYETLRDECGLESKWFDTYAGPHAHEPRSVRDNAAARPRLELLPPPNARGAAAHCRGFRRRGAEGGQRDRRSCGRAAARDGGARRQGPGALGAPRRGRRRTQLAGALWAGFEVRQDPHRLFIGGVLLEGTSVPLHAISLIQGFGRAAIFYPQRNGRVRAYAVYHRDVHPTRLQGPGDIPEFLQATALAGTPAGWLDGARAVGPLATFEGADTWTPHPYRNGVVLIGDAAAASDPSWGQGLSLTLRDVRVLRDALVQSEDWSAAARSYAEQHDTYYGTLRLVEDWYTKLFMEVGPEADARRAKALPLIMADPTRVPDVLMSGPNQPLGEADRLRFLGE